jgi:hypothetical protein
MCHIIRSDGLTERMNLLITRSVYGDYRGFLQYQLPKKYFHTSMNIVCLQLVMVFWCISWFSSLPTVNTKLHQASMNTAFLQLVLFFWCFFWFFQYLFPTQNFTEHQWTQSVSTTFWYPEVSREFLQYQLSTQNFIRMSIYKFFL